LGKLKFSHDSEIKFISLPRLFFAMTALCLTIYMIPGLWGAPLQGLSAWLPPQSMQDFNLSFSASSSKVETPGKKYSNLFHAPHGLDAFYDYEEGLAQAKKLNKPVLLDFTGWSCTNCRKMEASVWSNPEVLGRLKSDIVLVSLYVDDKTELPEQEKYISKFSGKKIKTIGQKWSDFEASTFGANSQPLYVIVDPEGNKLVPQQAFNLDIKNYINFLDSGKAAFRNKYGSN
jgi:thiol:disulfide interchange protein DsbD